MNGVADVPSRHARLAKLVEQVQRPGMVVIEVGCRSGGFTAALAPTVAQNKGTLHCIDWFRGTLSEQGNVNDPSSYDTREVLREFLANTEAWRNSIVLTVAESTQAAQLVPNRSADMVFLDADHQYDKVVADLDAWLPKVKRWGGLICGDDFEQVITPDDTLLYNKMRTWQNEASLQKSMAEGINWHFGVIAAVCDRFSSKRIGCENNLWWVRV